MFILDYLSEFGGLMNKINDTSTPTRNNEWLDKESNSQLENYQNRQRPPLTMEVSNEQEVESLDFQTTFNYCFQLEDDHNDSDELIAENQKLKHTLDRQDKEMGQIEFIPESKDICLPKGSITVTQIIYLRI